MEIIFVFIVMILIAFLLGPIRWMAIYKKNESEIKIDAKKDELIDFSSKYFFIANQHNEIYEQTKKENKSIVLLFGVFISFFLAFINWLFLLLIPILLFIVIITAGKVDKKEKILKLNKIYEETFYKDIACELLNIKSNKLEENIPEELFDDLPYEKFEEIIMEEENKEKKINQIMQKMNKKCYRDYYIFYDWDCVISEKQVNIKKIQNYEGELCYFCGYFVEIHDFVNVEKLKLTNNFFYDEQEKILYLFVSKKFDNLFLAISSELREKPNYNNSFYVDAWLSKKYNCLNQLKKIIEEII